MEIISFSFICLFFLLGGLYTQWQNLLSWKFKYYLSKPLQETILKECLESRSSHMKHLRAVRELIIMCDRRAKSQIAMGILDENQDKEYLSKLLKLIANPKSGLDAVACVTIPKTQEDEWADEAWSDF